MNSLSCPKCQRLLPDSALDLSGCHKCGYSFEQPVVLRSQLPRPNARVFWLVAVATGFAFGILAGFLAFRRVPDHSPNRHDDSATLRLHPLPRESLVQSDPQTNPTNPIPAAPLVPTQGHNAGTPATPTPVAIAPAPRPQGTEVVPVAPPQDKAEPQPPAPEIVLDPFEVRERVFADARAVVAIPDMNGKDHITLRGNVKVLKLGSINGEAVLDASALEAEEIHVSGDINGNCVVKLSAPTGKIVIGGYVVGSCKLYLNATGGEVVLREKSGRFGGGARIAITAKQVELCGLVNEGCHVAVTLNPIGSLRVVTMDGGAKVQYRRANPTDPPPRVESGLLRNGTKVVAEN